MRLFLSINWSNQVTREIEGFQDKLKQAGVKGYWRRGENLHLTLKFLGDTDWQRVNEINQELVDLGKRYQAFEVRINGLGAFPNLKQPRILYLQAHSSPLLEIQEQIEKKMSLLDFTRENRVYRPHITLASGGIQGLNNENLAIGNKLHLIETVDSFYLMESLQEGRKRVYRVLEDYSFRE